MKVDSRAGRGRAPVPALLGAGVLRSEEGEIQERQARRLDDAFAIVILSTAKDLDGGRLPPQVLRFAQNDPPGGWWYWSL